MMELTGARVHPQETSSRTTPLRVKLALAPDPTHDYTDMLRDIIDRAFEASAFSPIEIMIVDPADSEQPTSDEVAYAVPASLVAPPIVGRQTSGLRARWTALQHRAARLAPGVDASYDVVSFQ